MSLHTAGVISYSAVFTVAAAWIIVGLLILKGVIWRKPVPRSRAIPTMLIGAGIALTTAARIPTGPWAVLLSLPGVALILAGAYRLWRSR
ncbi:hypothetical protein ABIA32_006109 [Streptacidiphilus sp. MAP12-20]|uniref:hypothetical protein n=1 Tax=Streptacidiphilus sp. MAP12-20 TaxID=3156299 RepID=UPI00351533C9